MGPEKVIILVREMERWQEALQTALLLQHSGARVDLFCLADAPRLDTGRIELSDRQPGVACYASQTSMAAQLGIKRLPLAIMAERLQTADRVIPF